MERRDFIKKSLLTMALGAGAPSLLSQSALAAASKNKILLVVNLFGGNDQLNTLVPFRNDLYYRSRPNISVAKEKVLDLGKRGEMLGLHPELRPLMGMWEAGQMALIPQVGYPNPNRSHFVSTSIWHTADPAHHHEEGWLGRFGDSIADPFCDTFIGNASPQALMGKKKTAPAISGIESFTIKLPKTLEAQFEKELKIPRSGTPEEVRQSMLNLKGAVNKIGQLRSTKNKFAYPNNNFGKSLADVARMIAGGLGSSVYYATLGGWDTHSDQPNRQAELLGNLSQSISAFRSDMKAFGRDQDVMIMVFSEFGRRVEENSSYGTDHGQGGLMWVIGGGVKGGLFGTEPDLEDLDDGDLKYKTDFRNVYASALEWIEADGKPILLGDFKPLLLS